MMIQVNELYNKLQKMNIRYDELAKHKNGTYFYKVPVYYCDLYKEKDTFIDQIKASTNKLRNCELNFNNIIIYFDFGYTKQINTFYKIDFYIEITNL